MHLVTGLLHFSPSKQMILKQFLWLLNEQTHARSTRVWILHKIVKGERKNRIFEENRHCLQANSCSGKKPDLLKVT